MARPGLAGSGHRLVTVVALGTLAVGLSACSGAEQSGSLAHRVQVWQSGSGLGGDIGTLTADSARVTKVLAAHNGPGSIRADCALYDQDATQAENELPSPDTTLSEDLAQGYDDAGDAANLCYAGADGNVKDLARSLRYRISSQAYLNDALTLIGQITGSVPATTTTTSADDGSILG